MKRNVERSEIPTVSSGKLEQIARFLGHSSLESTTIYTHLSTEM